MQHRYIPPPPPAGTMSVEPEAETLLRARDVTPYDLLSEDELVWIDYLLSGSQARLHLFRPELHSPLGVPDKEWLRDWIGLALYWPRDERDRYLIDKRARTALVRLGWRDATSGLLDRYVKVPTRKNPSVLSRQRSRQNPDAIEISDESRKQFEKKGIDFWSLLAPAERAGLDQALDSGVIVRVGWSMVPELDRRAFVIEMFSSDPEPISEFGKYFQLSRGSVYFSGLEYLGTDRKTGQPVWRRILARTEAFQPRQSKPRARRNPETMPFYRVDEHAQGVLDRHGITFDEALRFLSERERAWLDRIEEAGGIVDVRVWERWSEREQRSVSDPNRIALFVRFPRPRDDQEDDFYVDLLRHIAASDAAWNLQLPLRRADREVRIWGPRSKDKRKKRFVITGKTVRMVG